MLPAKKAITPEEIILLVGGNDFTQHIPTDLKEAFSSFGLTELSARINTQTMHVLAIGAAIGAAKNWTMGDFTIESLVLDFQVLGPFDGPAKTVLVHFAAKARILQEVFQGFFDFNINFDESTKELMIAASYCGNVSLDVLVARLSGTITNPPQLKEIEFDTFGITFTKSANGYDFTLYGIAKVTFNILVAGSPIDADFRVKVDSATKSYTLIGGLTLGNQNFQVEVDLSASKQVLFVAHQRQVGKAEL